MHIVDTTMFWASASGGVRTYLEAKQRRLAAVADMRHSLLIPGANTGGGKKGYADSDRDEPVYRQPAPTLPFSNGYRFPLQPRQWSSALAALEPDLIEFGDPYVPAWGALAAGANLGVPVIGFYHSDLPALAASRVGAWTRPVVTAYVRQLYGRCDLVLAPSRTVADQLRALGLARVDHQHLGVDLECFHPDKADPGLRRDLGIAEDARLLVFAGRGAREKHIPSLLGCMRRLGGRYHLLLVGTGPLARLPDNVSVIESFQPVPRLAAIMASCDALRHGGDQETFGLVVVEAMACGLPVVGVRAGAVAELVAADCGELAPVSAAAPLAGAVRRLFARDAAQLGRAARRRAEVHYSWDTVIAQLLGHYRRLCARPWPEVQEQETYGGI